MERQVFVYVDLDGVPHLVGRLWGRMRKNKEGATFEYADAWQANPNRFSLEPALKLGPGQFHTTADAAMFGAIGDSAPDRWGRALMKRMARRRAEREGQLPAHSTKWTTCCWWTTRRAQVPFASPRLRVDLSSRKRMPNAYRG